MLRFIKTFERHVDFSQSGTRIGVVSYASHSKVDIHLDQYNEAKDFEKALKKVKVRFAAANELGHGMSYLQDHLFLVKKGMFLRLVFTSHGSSRVELPV